jgi:hypothetical protein
MPAITDSQTMQPVSLDRALEYAVIQSWDELMPDRTAGLIHIEYQTGNDGVIEFLKVWSSIARGTWKLVCELWMRPLWSHATGLRFENDYCSETLSNHLELIMEQEQSFPRSSEQAGLIQIHPPTQAERREADQWIELAFGRMDLAERHVAVRA